MNQDTDKLVLRLWPHLTLLSLLPVFCLVLFFLHTSMHTSVSGVALHPEAHTYGDIRGTCSRKARDSATVISLAMI